MLVSKDQPVLLIIPYNRLFYSVDYNAENAAGHGLLMIGYVEDRDSFMLMDSHQMWSANQDFSGASETFIRLPLSKAAFYLLLSDCKGDEPEIRYWSLQRIGESQISDFAQLIHWFIQRTGISENSLISYLLHYDTFKSQFENERTLATHFRQQMNGAMDAFWYGIEEMLKETKADDAQMEEYAELKKQYSALNDRITLLICKKLLSRTSFPEHERDAMIQSIRDKEKDLIAFLCRMLQRAKENKVNHRINLTAWSSAAADSGAPILIHPGKEDATVIWESLPEPGAHEMVLTFEKPIVLFRIEIVHSGISGLVTSDYELQMSEDGIHYKTIVAEIGNEKPQANYEFNGIHTKYIKLHVEKASEYECNTKIKGFQVFGEWAYSVN